MTSAAHPGTTGAREPPSAAPPAVTTGRVERLVRRIDAFQQHRRPVAFTFAVFKKFGDDRGSTLAVLLAYYGFVALFPLLLLLVTILGLLLGREGHLQQRILNSALSEFPIIGDQLARNIHSLHTGGFGIAVGIGGLVWGALGIAQIGQHAMAQVWNVKGVERPGFFTRLARSLVFLGTLGLGLAVTTIVTAVVAAGHHGAVIDSFGVVVSVAVNAALFVAVFRVLTPKQIPPGQLIPGALCAGVAWSLLQGFGGYLIGHQLRHASQVYGLFGLVLGLLSFLTLAATMTLYAAEVNVVHARHLWPRSILQPPLTPSDERVLADIAAQEERRPEQVVSVTFDDPPGSPGATTAGETPPVP